MLGSAEKGISNCLHRLSLFFVKVGGTNVTFSV